jgi:hypothetical protein
MLQPQSQALCSVALLRRTTAALPKRTRTASTSHAAGSMGVNRKGNSQRFSTHKEVFLNRAAGSMGVNRKGDSQRLSTHKELGFAA